MGCVRRGFLRLAAIVLWTMAVWVVVMSLERGAIAQTATVTATTGQVCAGTRFGSDLNCTSNDFTASLTFDQPSGSAISECRAGETIIIDVIADVQSNSPNRYDIGFFLGENGINPDLNNAASSCSIGLFPTSPLPFQASDSDSCGDFQSNGAATLLINDAVVKCLPVAGTNSLALPYVMAFNNNTSGNTCNVSNIVPGTTAKCVKATTSSVTGVTVNGFVTVTKQTTPDTQPGTFSFSTGASPIATVSPASASLADGASQTFQVPLVAGGTRTLTITEALLSGWESTASISCATPSGGSSSGYVTVDNVNRTITANLTAADYGAVCTITNTKIPTVKVQKLTRGGADGPFAFSATNLASGISPITTTVAATATPASPTAIEVSARGTAVTITETVDSDYTIESAACTDANSSRTGNSGSIGSLSGTTLTIPAGQVSAGADYTCVFTNDKRPTLTLVAVSNGGLDSFSYAADNGFGADAITTTTIGVGATGTTTQLTTDAAATAITATIPAGWWLAGASCTGMGSGGSAGLSSNVLTLDAAAVLHGTNVVCTFTYNKIPIVRVQKTTTGGFGGPFAFVASNLAASISDISTAAADTPTPTSPGIHYVSAAGTAVDITESFSLAWITTGAECTDANTAVTGNSNPVATSATASITVPGAAVVHGADITCTYTNPLAVPELALSKTANVASVDDAGDVVAYTLEVSNTGNVPLNNVTLDDALGTVTCPSSGTDVIAALAVGGSETCAFSYTATQADFDGNGGGDGDIDNAADASSTYNGSPVSANATVAVTLNLRKTLELLKDASPATSVSVGTTVTYTYRVRNTGNQTLSNIAVGDVHGGYGTAPVPGGEAILSDAAPINDSTDTAVNGIWDVLKPGDEVQFSAPYQVTQQDMDLLQ